MATTEETIETRRSPSGAQIALIVGAVVVLLAVLWFFVLSPPGDEGDETAAPAPEDTVFQPEVDPSEPARKPDKPLVETFEVLAPKDPFDPLVTQDSGTGGGPTGDTTDDGTGDTDGDGTPDDGTGDTDGDGTPDGTDTDGDGIPDDSDGDDDGDGVPDGDDGSGDGDGDTDGTGTDSVDGHRVKLVATFQTDKGARAQVDVDGTVYTVDEGETFAENFQLVSVSGECATMLFGDDQFTLCEGEEILK